MCFTWHDITEATTTSGSRKHCKYRYLTMIDTLSLGYWRHHARHGHDAGRTIRAATWSLKGWCRLSRLEISVGIPWCMNSSPVVAFSWRNYAVSQAGEVNPPLTAADTAFTEVLPTIVLLVNHWGRNNRIPQRVVLSLSSGAFCVCIAWPIGRRVFLALLRRVPSRESQFATHGGRHHIYRGTVNIDMTAFWCYVNTKGVQTFGLTKTFSARSRRRYLNRTAQ